MADNHDEWRSAARRILKSIPGTDVETYGHVHVMQDGSGAFVECILWVPLYKRDEPTDERKS